MGSVSPTVDSSSTGDHHGAMDDTHVFAERLRQLREKAGLSQYALSQLSGLTKQALSRLELGEREPTWDTVQQLAAALGVSTEAFQSSPPTGSAGGGERAKKVSATEVECEGKAAPKRKGKK